MWEFICSQAWATTTTKTIFFFDLMNFHSKFLIFKYFKEKKGENYYLPAKIKTNKNRIS